MVSIRINETGEYLDLNREFVGLTFQIFDISTLGTVQGTFSNDFRIPDTAHNRAALGNATQKNVYNSTYKVNQKIPASCFQNNIEISKGFIQINEKEDKEIDITFWGDNIDVFELLRGKKLRDASLTYLRHTYTGANVVASFNNTSGYIYPVIDYGLFTSVTPMAITSGQIYPAIFVPDIMTAIFKDIGFKIDGTMLDRALYKKSTVPFVNNFFGYSKEYVYSKNFEVRSDYFNIAAGATIKDNFTIKTASTTVTSALFDLTSDRYTADDDYQISLNYNFSSAAFQRDNGPVTSVPFPTLYIKVNGILVATSSVTRAVVDITLAAGDYVEFEVKNNHSGTVRFQGTALGGVSQQFVTGSVIYPETILPDMDQVDFVKWAISRFAGVLSVDLYNKTFYFNQFNDLKNNPVDDWSDKLDLSKKAITNYGTVLSGYGTTNLMLYSVDDNDKQQTLYNVDNDVPYGGGRFEIDNDFLGDEKTIFETPFSSTLSIETFGANALLVPYIPRHLPNQTDINVALPRILTFYGNIGVDQISTISSMTIMGVTVTSIPFMYFFKSSTGFGVDDFKESLAYGIQNVFNPNDLGAMESDYLMILNILNNPETVKAYLKLNQIDIVNLNHLKKKYIERLGGYFYLNKIEDYDASGDSVLCELVKI